MTRLEAAIDAGIEWKERSEYWKEKVGSLMVMNVLKDEELIDRRAKRVWLISGGLLAGVGAAVSAKTAWGLAGVGAGSVIIYIKW